MVDGGEVNEVVTGHGTKKARDAGDPVALGRSRWWMVDGGEVNEVVTGQVEGRQDMQAI